MDIFTTVLTRVVPVPIKPANLKVKALLKSANVGNLTEDFDHLENHDNYFDDDSSKKESLDSNNHPEHQEHQEVIGENDLTDEKQIKADSSGISESLDGVKHLDIYI